MTPETRNTDNSFSFRDWLPILSGKPAAQPKNEWPPRSLRRKATKPVAPNSANWRSVRFATSGSVRRIQAWLERHCEGRWHIGITGVDKYLATKFGEVHFENFADKQRFKAFFLAEQNNRQPAFGAALAPARIAA
ncbi:MAG: hypothetical protein MI741_04980 [Rhodospirillales bacterium]|nr:hypothetical protein [Rhodospirillales bacterium]